MKQATPSLDSHHKREQVRERYAAIAEQKAEGCCGSSRSCCSDSAEAEFSSALGYSAEELAAAPAGANLNLGCGNPLAIASIRPGETVVDLGSGAGFDCFLAARQLAGTGRVIGVDMTPPMIAKARVNAARTEFDNVEFRLGEIEHLPLADNSADIIISNCVINLSPEKAQVFREAFRVLRPGGRVAVADMVATAPIPEEAKHDVAHYTGCITGAATVDELTAMLRDAGFVDIRIREKATGKQLVRTWAPGTRLEEFVFSASIEAVKPAP